MKFLEIKRSKKMAVLIAITLLLIVSLQFTSPTITNPPVTSDFAGPDSITTIFRRACYDCHSNETRLEWYDNIAPVSWMVAADVQEARKRFNFSHWDSLSSAEQVGKLWYMVNMIDQGKMPLPGYVSVHPSAKVSETEIATLKNYVVALSSQKTSSAHKPAANASVMVKVSTNTSHKTPVSPNDISYFGDYKTWKVIAATNRFDNGTMRIIYGNDIAVKAIQQNTIDPWPNGTKIAKVVWNKQPEDEEGNITAGEFNNVQFMIRDDKKFKHTEGWGFARFSTPQLISYGKSAAFEMECINCHRLASANGFVFDIPTKKNLDVIE
jgi:hypothetical protein